MIQSRHHIHFLDSWTRGNSKCARLDHRRTYDSLDAYPKGAIIAIGTNGFTKRVDGRQLFMEEVSEAVEKLKPSGIITYGPVDEQTFILQHWSGLKSICPKPSQ